MVNGVIGEVTVIEVKSKNGIRPLTTNVSNFQMGPIRCGNMIACVLCLALMSDSSRGEGESPSVKTEVVPASNNADSSSKYQLRYKFDSGQFLHYDVSDQILLVTQQAGVSVETRQDNRVSKHYRVVSVDNESAEAVVEPIIDRIQMKGKISDQPEVNFDSQSNDIVPTEFQRHKDAIGKPLVRFRFSPVGKLVSVQPVDKDLPKWLMSADGKIDNKLNFLIPLPEEPIAVGYRWKEKYDQMVPVGKGLNQQIPFMKQYELVSVSDGIATIKFKTSVLAVLDDAKIQGQLAQQIPSGVIEFDLERGMIRSRVTTTNETVVNAFGPQTLLKVAGKSTESIPSTNSVIQQTGFSKRESSNKSIEK